MCATAFRDVMCRMGLIKHEEVEEGGGGGGRSPEKGGQRQRHDLNQNDKNIKNVASLDARQR